MTNAERKAAGWVPAARPGTWVKPVPSFEDPSEAEKKEIKKAKKVLKQIRFCRIGDSTPSCFRKVVDETELKTIERAYNTIGHKFTPEWDAYEIQKGN